MEDKVKYIIYNCKYVNVEVRLEAVVKNGVLHILDTNERDTRTVTNEVSNEFIKEIDRHFKKEYDEVFLYGVDGVISKWENGFYYVDHNDLEEEKKINRFLDICNKRKEKFKEIKK